MKHKCHKIAVLPGDGIGPEVIRAALPVFDVLDIKTNIRYGGIGWEHWCHSGNPVPPETWDLVHTSDATLLGAITSKPEREAKNDLDKRLDPDVYTYVSPVVQLRQKLNLSTNLRPVLDLWNNNFDFIVLRENTEGLYAGFDQFPPDRSIWDILSTSSNAAVSGRYGTSVTLRLQTEVALKNLLLKGFELADSRKKLLTIADKPNVLRQSSQLLRKVADSLMCDYPDVTVEILNVDAVAMWMVRRPERFDVIAAENMFGDILSDIGAGIMGGLGLASSANIGHKYAYFEPVHGSAPHLAGTSRANPMAVFLSIAALLDYLHEKRSANRIRNAVRTVIRSGDVLTYDLGGSSSTQEVADSIISEIERDDYL